MAIAFHATTAPPTSANAAQAMRHCSVTSSTAGPERATPMLVPELIRAFALSCSSSRRDAATASPMGGEAAAAASEQHPKRKHPTRGGAGDGRHADDRHRPGGDRHKARARAGGEHERPEYRQAVAGVGAGTDQP